MLQDRDIDDARISRDELEKKMENDLLIVRKHFRSWIVIHEDKENCFFRLEVNDTFPVRTIIHGRSFYYKAVTEPPGKGKLIYRRTTKGRVMPCFSAGRFRSDGHLWCYQDMDNQHHEIATSCWCSVDDENNCSEEWKKWNER